MRQAVIGFGTLYLVALGGAWLVASWQVWLLAAMLVAPMVWLSATDLTRFIIPDSATAAIAAIGLGSTWAGGRPGWTGPVAALLVLGAAWGGGTLYFRHRGREGLGIGDAKLLAAITLVVGPSSLWIVVFLAAMAGIVAIVMARGRGDRACPFGPFLAFACFLTVLLYPRP